MPDGVVFSLNKQGRWGLPEVLKEIIMADELDGEDYGVQMVMRDTLMRNANCFSVLASDGVYANGVVDKSVKEKVFNRYFQLNNILSGEPPFNLTKRYIRHWNARGRPDEDGQNEVNDGRRPKPQVRYEFHYPASSSSFMTHDAKTIGSQIWSPFKWTGFQDKFGSSPRRRRLRNDIMESVHDMLDDHGDYQSEYDETDINDVENNVTVDSPKEYLVSFSELLVHKNNLKRIARHQKCNNFNSQTYVDEGQVKSTHQRIVHVSQEKAKVNGNATLLDIHVPSEETEPSQFFNTAHVDCNPVKVVLNKEETEPELLSQRFGDKIIEGSCCPRSFAIDISRRKCRLDALNAFCRSKTSPAAFIVFVQNINDSRTTPKDSVFEIHLNANFNELTIKSIRIETLFDYVKTHIEVVIERTVLFLHTLPFGAINADEFLSKRKMPTCHRSSLLETLLKCQSLCIFPTDQYIICFLEKTVIKNARLARERLSKVNAVTDNVADVTSQAMTSKICAICVDDPEHDVPGVALTSCDHWFCKDCWRNHLYTQIRNGVVEVKCPQFKCSTIVDPGTLISLVNIKQVIQLARRLLDNFIQANPETMWCPNNACRRLILLQNVNSGFTTCDCGINFCVKCLRPPHWPVACDNYSQYITKMRTLGDTSLLPPEASPHLAVNVANCPECERLVQKNGGCPLVVCLCREAFCWGCKKPWEGKTHGKECYKSGTIDIHGTKSVHLKVDELRHRNRVGWYKKALCHRIHQHQARIALLKAAVRFLAKGVCRTISKAARTGKPIILEGYDFYPGTEYKAGMTFLNDTVDMYSELNHVAENTWAMLGTSALDSNVRRKVCNLSTRLSVLADEIFKALTMRATGQQEVQEMLSRLASVRKHGRIALRCLIRTTNRQIGNV